MNPDEDVTDVRPISSPLNAPFLQEYASSDETVPISCNVDLPVALGTITSGLHPIYQITSQISHTLTSDEPSLSQFVSDLTTDSLLQVSISASAFDSLNYFETEPVCE